MLFMGTRKYAGNKRIDRSLLPEKPPLYEESRPGRMVVGRVEQTLLWHGSAAITPSSLRRFESHFVRQLSHSRPVEQKATATHERPGEKVKCIEDRLSPHLCCLMQLLYNIVLIINNLYLDYHHHHFPLFHVHAAVLCLCLCFFQFYPSPSFSPLSSSLFHSLSFLLSQCNVIQD